MYAVPKTRLTPEQYLAIERKAEYKSEYYNGEMFAMAGASEPHNRIKENLVVEIGSRGTRKRDETIKQRLYERGGVSEYWVIDPELDVIKVYRLVEGRYTRVHELTLEAEDVLTTPLLPGLTLPLTAIFHEPSF